MERLSSKEKKSQLHFRTTALAVLGIVTICYIFFYFFHSKEVQIQTLAQESIERCSSEKYPTVCYDREIPRLVDRGVSMEDVFLVVAEVQHHDPLLRECHLLAHSIALKETAKDQSNWLSVLNQCPENMCKNGCLHGVVQEHFQQDVMTDAQLQENLPLLGSVCDSALRGFRTIREESDCAHGLGHLSAYITGADVPKALATCDALTLTGLHTQRELCYGGLFMAVFEPVDRDDKALVHGLTPQTKEASRVFCSQFSSEQESVCNRSAFSLYVANVFTASGLKFFCGLANDQAGKQSCYDLVFRKYVDVKKFTVPDTEQFCSQFTHARQGQCLAIISSWIVGLHLSYLPDAITLCTYAETLGLGTRCFGQLLYISTFNYPLNSKEFTTVCNALPAPWKSKCLNGEGALLPSSIIDEYE